MPIFVRCTNNDPVVNVATLSGPGQEHFYVKRLAVQIRFEWESVYTLRWDNSGEAERKDNGKTNRYQSIVFDLFSEF